MTGRVHRQARQETVYRAFISLNVEGDPLGIVAYETGETAGYSMPIDGRSKAHSLHLSFDLGSDPRYHWSL